MTTNEHDNMSEAVGSGSGSGAPAGDALPQLTEGFFKAINEKFDPGNFSFIFYNFILTVTYL